MMAVVVEGCKGIGRRCEQRQMRNCHLRRETGGKGEAEGEEGVGVHGYAGSLYFAGLLQSPIPLPFTSGVNSSLPDPPPVSEDPPGCHLPLLPGA